MSCRCEKCGFNCDCGERFCERCFLETLDEPKKKIYLGGEFVENVQSYEKKEDE